MPDLTPVQAAYQAYQSHPTDEGLAAFIVAAQDFLFAGGTLPDDMAHLYQLATSAQPLPPATTTASNWLPLIFIAVLIGIGVLMGMGASDE